MHDRDAHDPFEPDVGPGHSGPNDEPMPAHDPALEPDEPAEAADRRRPSEGATHVPPEIGEAGPIAVRPVGRSVHRVERDESTPVVGSAQPLRGLSGLLRSAAYRIPEHHTGRWVMLFVADRLDVVEHRLGDALAEPFERAGMMEESRSVRSNPLPVFVGVVAGAWAARRLLRSARGVLS